MEEGFYCCAEITDRTVREAGNCRDYRNRRCYNGFGRPDGVCSVLFLAEKDATERGERFVLPSEDLPPLTLGQ